MKIVPFILFLLFTVSGLIGASNVSEHSVRVPAEGSGPVLSCKEWWRHERGRYYIYYSWDRLQRTDTELKAFSWYELGRRHEQAPLTLAQCRQALSEFRGASFCWFNEGHWRAFRLTLDDVQREIVAEWQDGKEYASYEACKENLPSTRALPEPIEGRCLCRCGTWYGQSLSPEPAVRGRPGSNREIRLFTLYATNDQECMDWNRTVCGGHDGTPGGRRVTGRFYDCTWTRH